MSWYKAGTVAVTTGSATVLGTGTQWVSKLKIGEVFYAPDGKLYEIETISSDTTLTLTLPYAGDSNPAGAYVVIPTQGYLRSLASNVADLIALYQAVPDNVEHAEAAATNAAASAALATDKATLAENARSFAVFAKAAAEAAQDAAEAAQDAATTSAALAGTKAAEASVSSSAALASKGAAETAQTAAAGSATTATTKANEASTSASTASTAASTATTKAAEAATSAGDALTSKNSAATSAGTATTKAGDAATSATNAADSATTASTKANEAAASATAANQSKVDAQAIKDSMTAAAVTSVAGRTGAVTLAKGDVGLGNVDNTADANKPLSNAQQTALSSKAPIASPAFTGTPTAPTASAGTATTQVATTAFVGFAAPPGMVGIFAGSMPPTGWLKANGAAVSRTTYAALFAAIGTTYGTGDGSTTFNLPEARGEFPRFWDDGRTVDSGRAIGSAQGQATPDHNHRLPLGWDGGQIYAWMDGGGGPVFGSEVVGGTYRGRVAWSEAPASAASRIAYSESKRSESGANYPRNMAFLGCIKF